jgi:hypothetical protein
VSPSTTPAEDRAIVNAGLKALAFDWGPPLVCPPRPTSAPPTSMAGSASGVQARLFAALKTILSGIEGLGGADTDEWN